MRWRDKTLSSGLVLKQTGHAGERNKYKNSSKLVPKVINPKIYDKQIRKIFQIEFAIELDLVTNVRAGGKGTFIIL